MGISKASDFKIYQPQFFGGMSETLQMAADVFNTSSRGAIAMSTAIKKGDFEQESFFQVLSSLISRQDITSTSSASDQALTQSENASVKLHRKIGPVAVTRKAFLQMGESPEEVSFILGQQSAQAVAEEMINTSLKAARVALAAKTNIVNDVTGNAGNAASCTHKNLLQTLAKFGDKNNRIVAWVMHSQNFFDLAVNGTEDNITGIASEIIRVVDVAGFGRPIIIVDSPSLISSSTYFVLGLQAGAIQIQQTEDQYMTSQEITGLEQIVDRLQGEYAYNLGLKGFTWDISNGGANPDASTVATATNWDQTCTSDKDLAGCVLKCSAAS